MLQNTDSVSGDGTKIVSCCSPLHDRAKCSLIQVLLNKIYVSVPRAADTMLQLMSLGGEGWEVAWRATFCLGQVICPNHIWAFIAQVQVLS
jgi:hypothetical protein